MNLEPGTRNQEAGTKSQEPRARIQDGGRHGLCNGCFLQCFQYFLYDEIFKFLQIFMAIIGTGIRFGSHDDGEVYRWNHINILAAMTD